MAARITDVIVLGAGHNGLVCANYLAAAGLQVTVLERRSVVGGAAVTEEFVPGFRNSSASYTVSLLHPTIIRDLRLSERGLRVVERPFANFVPLLDGRALRFGGAAEKGSAFSSTNNLAQLSPKDAQRLPEHYARLKRIADMLRQWLLRTPPEIGGRWVVSDLTSARTAVQFLRDVGRLGLPAQRDLLAAFTRSAGHWLDSMFECDALKAALGFDSIVGNYASPYAAGTAYVLLHHGLGEVNGKPGAWGHAIGGMGRITQLMAEEAQSRGVHIQRECEVRRVLVEAGRAVGVELLDGRRLPARAVAAGLNPKLLYQKLLDPQHLDEGFRAAIGQYHCASGSFRLNVALSELPDFACQPGTHAQEHHASGILLGPSLHAMDQAWHDAVRTGYSRLPIVEMLVPSVVDDSLAPPGRHVASLFCQHFDPTPAGGWDACKAGAVEAIFRTVESYCPNFRRSLLGYKAWSPLDLERDYGLIGGDIFHGRLSLDQLFCFRPLIGNARYRGPVRALYHCGSGAHPGGGVSGAPGRNAAREILRDWSAITRDSARGAA
ncbi:MAG TPA: NAD(P)/FAD-dependent oxidoreductase [Burkholderiaceae bacterium]|nr:NAD(P)/FAD-dependent oxidoreductase [Burkholderiaceae bacterium]